MYWLSIPPGNCVGIAYSAVVIKADICTFIQVLKYVKVNIHVQSLLDKYLSNTPYLGLVNFVSYPDGLR